MEVMYSRCAGLDVHKKVMVACVRVIDGGRVVRQKQRFGTTTAELARMADWMTGHQVTHAAMESTGVYWKPVWHVLERDFLILANAQHVKAIPGRKSGMSDAEWLAPHPWIDPRQLRATGGDPGIAGVDPHPEAAVARVRQTSPSDSEGARGRQRQALRRRQRHLGQGESRDSRSHHCR